MRGWYTRSFHQSLTRTIQSFMAYQLLNLINRLQRAQNAAGRLIFRTPKSHHITPVLQQLHWLPVKDQTSFKLLLLTSKALHGLAPIYISELIKPYNPSRSLRLSTLNYLSVPKSNTATYGDRCFSVAAPKLWNSLPGDFRYIENLCTFKTSIKTWLFKSAFNLAQFNGYICF